MSRLFKAVLVLSLFLLADTIVANACTSVIISGRITEDGRPIMWKNRDSGDPGQNMMMFIKGKKYDFVGIVNADITKPKAVWGGVNSQGLCIMNTLSYNVDIRPAEDKASSGNGLIQFEALSNCRDMAEFEELLASLPHPTGLVTNLGVIDAKGNCAYFECHNYGYKKYDVNDPGVAPEGFLVRSNYSVSTRPPEEGKGQIRYMEAERQIRRAIADRTVNVDFILENLARSFSNPLMGIDLKSGVFNKPRTRGWYADEDFITRITSRSSMVFQGVKENEKPELTTMWTIIGYPPASVCVPVWVKGGEKGLPRMLAPDETRHSPMSRNAFNLLKTVYTYDLDNSKENHERYFNWELLFNLQGTGIMQKVLAKEAEILPPYKAALETWRKKNKVDVAQLTELNAAADAAIAAFYKEEFNL